MSVPEAIERRRQRLLGAYASTWAEIKAEEQRIVSDVARHRRLRRLRELGDMVEVRMAALEAATSSWVATEMPYAYGLGAFNEARRVGERFDWALLDRAALDHLADDTGDQLLRSTRYVRRDVKRVIRRVATDEALSGRIRGETAKDTARRVAAFLDEEGLSGIRYRNGALHGLDDYADMVIRTNTALAHNAGVMSQGVAMGVEYWVAFDGPDCGVSAHGQGELASGRIFTREEMEAYPIAHPRCQRSFASVPEASTRGQAQALGPFVTDEQIASQRAAAELTRRRQLAPARQRRLRQARSDRRRRYAEAGQ